jgi:LPS-assembly lipoprotein
MRVERDGWMRISGPPSPTLLRMGGRKMARLALALILAVPAAGCFQPMYGDSSLVRTAGLDNRLAGVEVMPINTPNGTALARVGVGVRNDLIYDLTGGGYASAPTHRLNIQLSSTHLQVIVDVNTARPEVQNYGINATYTLTDIATGKTVVSGQTFSRVSYDIPGQQQRFAGARALRDAENRAAKVIADNIKSRLASYFIAGT